MLPFTTFAMTMSHLLPSYLLLSIIFQQQSSDLAVWVIPFPAVGSTSEKTTNFTTQKSLPNEPYFVFDASPFSILPNTTPTMKTSAHDSTPSTPLSPVRVDVNLCGSMSRSEIADKYLQQGGAQRGAPCGELTPSHLNAIQIGDSPTLNQKSPLYDDLMGIVSQNPSMARIQSVSCQPTPTYEPPSWSVPARGEARLEVSQDDVDVHDLAWLPLALLCDCFTHLSLPHPIHFPVQPVCEALGRQTSVDLTAKSSYRIGRSPQSDVQLQHGTSSRRHALLFHHSNGSCYIVDCGSAHGTYVNGVRIKSPPKGGVVIPHKVRRGAMIRFGGPGAPCFVLKSFTFNLEELAESASLVRSVSEEEAPACVVQKNTRLNALGQTAIDTVRLSVLNMTSKRSFDSLDGAETFDEPCSKRARCSSPPLFPEEPLRLVSPDLPPASQHRRVSFSPGPPTAFYPSLVTPEELSSEEDNGAY